MWIIRFQKLQTKDYNYINRKLKKCWFITRKNPPILFIKALIYNLLEKKSWRFISTKIWINHILLFKFFSNYTKQPEIKEIFHYLADIRVIAYVWEKKNFNLNDIDNTDHFLKLTKNELDIIFQSLK